MEFQAYDIAIIPVIVAIVGLIGKAGLGPRFLPLCSLILGVVAGLVYIAPSDPKQAVFAGIVIGLSACGAYSGVKNSIEKRQE